MLFEQVPAEVWQQAWVVHCQPVGNGERALKYLAPYIFRVAISNSRIVKLENGQVTFRYRSARGRREQTCTLPAEEFIRRFLQHVLPRGFVKVRYYGLFSPAYRPVLHQLRLRLAPPLTEAAFVEAVAHLTAPAKSPATPPCPHCGRPMLSCSVTSAGNCCLYPARRASKRGFISVRCLIKVVFASQIGIKWGCHCW